MNHPETNIQAETVPKVSFYEKRKKIYAKGVRGYFDNWRIGLVLLTQVIFYGGLWLEWNGRQAILLDIDSPGGEAGGVFELARQIRAADARKPVWAIASDSATSAYTGSFWSKKRAQVVAVISGARAVSPSRP